MDFFITRPEHDDTTFYLSNWSKELIELAKTNGINVLDFDKERATATEVEKILKKKSPRLVMFNGHGNKETVMGHQNAILIKHGVNEELLKNKIVYCRSCSSAAILGKESISKGTTAFLGYTNLFGFSFNPQRSATPLKDEFAKPCLESSNQIIKALLKGHTVLEAYKSSQQATDDWIEKMQRSDAPPEASHILLWLVWNKINQKFYGEESAKICE
ncbi:MAG: hypothetical protein PHD95_02975 [Candidatus ainarchaeum sp.]|nr:hypothetical protein [Candidatus ainarchaeum sp.]